MAITTVKEARKHVGSHSNTDKMPGVSYGIQSKDCGIGSKLANIEGSVCEKCYGNWGFYFMPNVKRAEDLRKELMESDPLWEDSMVFLNLRLKPLPGDDSPYFRWFDNGDLQSTANLERIVRVCERTPGVKYWLPTKEYGIVNEFLSKGGVIPDNLSIRASGYMFNDPPPAFAKTGKFQLMQQIPTSTATYLDENQEPERVHGHLCPAHWQQGQCGDCRACWSKEVPNVTYPNQRQKIK